MSRIFVRLFLILSIVTSILIGEDRAVRSQPVESNETPSEVPSNPDTPAEETPAEKPEERKLRRSIGIGVNIGVSGNNTGLSEGGAALLTKNDLSDRFSIRSINVFTSDRSDNTIALTANFPVRSGDGEVRLVPFVGGGVLLSSKYSLSDLIIRGLVTGGIDLPLSRRFTATTSVNVGFTDTANVGMQLGVRYNF